MTRAISFSTLKQGTTTASTSRRITSRGVSDADRYNAVIRFADAPDGLEDSIGMALLARAKMLLRNPPYALRSGFPSRR